MDSDRSFNDISKPEQEYFIYSDTDNYQNEIAELYSYTELSEFRQNFRSYAIEIHKLKATTKWLSLDQNEQKSFMMSMIERLEVSNESERMRASRCILYLAQGCWMEVKNIEDQQLWARKNILILYNLGAFTAFMDLLNIELEKSSKTDDTDTDAEDVHVTMIDSSALRLIMNNLYTLMETIRAEKDKENPDFMSIAVELANELSNPLDDSEFFQIKLLNMMIKYCNGISPHFPIKKIVLLLWKSTLIALGGMQTLKELKDETRLKAGLSPIKTDTLEVIKQMNATIIADEDIHMSRKILLAGKRVKAALFDNKDEAAAFLKKETSFSPKQVKSITKETKLKENIGNSNDSASVSPKNIPRSPCAIKAQSPNNDCPNKTINNALLFEAKVRSSDIEKFLQTARQKFFGFTLDCDQETVIGLPAPILESVLALQRHLYVSIGELQIIAEKQSSKKTSINDEENSDINPSEKLYQAMLPKMWDYIRDLLQIQLAASPTAKLTAGNINARIITDMLPKNPSQTAIFSTTMKSDVLRHKEIIVKAVSGFLLLCLKHFKLNHIYQSEYICQLLIQANFIKLTLQLFTPSFTEYVHSITNIPAQEFPACVIAQDSEHSLFGTENVINDFIKPKYSWRNMFTSVNLLRILNKVVKLKPSRILNMVYLKSHNILKESLKVQHPILQVYALKLLKMQAKYLGRNWRRHNLKVLTAIYTKVRPRFIDDWAYGCNTVGDFWGSQEDEMDVFARVRDYHLKHFPTVSICNMKANEKPIYGQCNNLNLSFEECKASLPIMEISKQYEEANEVNEMLSEDFKENYEIWLDNQVFNNPFDWDTI